MITIVICVLIGVNTALQSSHVSQEDICRELNTRNTTSGPPELSKAISFAKTLFCNEFEAENFNTYLVCSKEKTSSINAHCKTEAALSSTDCPRKAEAMDCTLKQSIEVCQAGQNELIKMALLGEIGILIGPGKCKKELIEAMRKLQKKL
ncbi:unnamed protein product, partial [Mesorhabditis belari]|uniref:Uncharacterized protein n=1 Tax=Mesorhabditis belari TaxID=2138241 RepID=A0AAF3EMX5_9BILA